MSNDGPLPDCPRNRSERRGERLAQAGNETTREGSWALSENMLRGVATLVGGGFIGYAVIAIVLGRFYDSDDGPIDRAARPLAFWLSVIAMTLLGLFILGVGYRWKVVRAIFELAGQRF